MTTEFEKYKQRIRDDITTCLDAMCVQPIIFIGSGLSRRYFGAPSWIGLLQQLAVSCPLIKDYVYYEQKYKNNPIEIGSAFIDPYYEWAWSSGKSSFPSALFSSGVSSEAFIKHQIASLLETLLKSTDINDTTNLYFNELTALKNIRPQAIITTNYDRFLEKLFPDYTPIIGQKILRTDFTQVGEILKIHGCSSQPESLVFSKNDYSEFCLKKKYLSAKLLTFFAEHPLFFFGYSAEDPNIKALLSDIDEILSPNNILIPNMYLVEWNPNAEHMTSFQQEKIITTDDARSVRIKSILSNDFQWIFESITSDATAPTISQKLLRAIIARTYTLVRKNIPNRTVDVDFETLERTVSSDEEFAKLYGITNLNDPTAFNAKYPFTITQVASHLNYTNWNPVHKLICQVTSEKGIDIKTSDNNYHISVRTGQTGTSHKYSQAAIDLLQLVKNNQEYEVML